MTKISKDWIEKVIRHNRPGIAAAQIYLEIAKLNAENDKGPPAQLDIKDVYNEWESPRERVF